MFNKGLPLWLGTGTGIFSNRTSRGPCRTAAWLPPGKPAMTEIAVYTVSVKASSLYMNVALVSNSELKLSI